jgi:hypothetical protein
MPSENCPAPLVSDLMQADQVDQLVDAPLRNPVGLRE